MNQPVESVAAPAPPSNAVAALFKVLLEPRNTFEALKPLAPWILPFVVMLLAVAAFTYVNWPYIMDQRIEAFQASDQIPAEQKTQIIADMQAKRDAPSPVDVSMGPIFVGVFSLLGAAVWLLLGNVVSGGDGSFKTLWSAFNFAGMVGVVEMVLKTIMIQMKQSANVYTSLALLAPDLDTRSFAFRALDAVDLFSLWFFLVMAVGVSVMCKVKARKATTVALIAFVVWAVGFKAGLGSLVGGMFGM